jgi:NAD(P)-dependent dehydrogenase (short-subunit alcohol dehydrogenase family)
MALRINDGATMTDSHNNLFKSIAKSRGNTLMAVLHQVAIVTGGASGIGQALCHALATRGAVVIVADINVEGAQDVAEAIRRRGGQAAAQKVDVADAGSVQQLIQHTVATHKRLDYLFNNAGIAVTADARDLRAEHWHRVIAVNLLGVIYGIQAAYPFMAQQGYGHIVNTASLAGLLPYPTNLPYATTKHAVVGLSLSLRAEAADLGVKVSVVCPGWVQSGIYAASPTLNVRHEQQTAFPFKLMEADTAARRILAGVARNQPVIVFPPYARVLWWVYRMRATWLNALGSKLIRDLRRLRLPTAVGPDRE